MSGTLTRCVQRKLLTCVFQASRECRVRNRTVISSALVLVYDADMDTGGRGSLPLSLLPSVKKMENDYSLVKTSFSLNYPLIKQVCVSFTI